MDDDRCAEIVYERDTYRRDSRAKGGFSMHYTRRRCKRKPLPGGVYCKQHSEIRYRFTGG
jgi:hypothetical protein